MGLGCVHSSQSVAALEQHLHGQPYQKKLKKKTERVDCLASQRRKVH